MSILQRIGAAFVLFLTAAGAAGAQPAERPNVVLIIADDLGYGDLGSYGSPIMRTPRLDRLAGQGVRFTAAYVAAAVCSPSRAGLMTGRYPQRHGYEFNTSGRDVEIGLSTAERTLGDLMRGAGYATGYVGKWHLGRRPAQQPLSRGFGEYFGVLTGGTTYFDGSHPEAVLDPDRPPGTRAGREIYRGRDVVEVDDYLTDVFTREAVDFIDRHAGGDAPFFLVLSYNAPHTPLQATREYMETVAHVEDFRTRIYAAMVSSVDRGVGTVVDRLAAHGVDDDTLIVFMSDNGCVGYAAIACSNGPFSGTKRFHLEGGIRIPFIMHWPDGLEGGQVYREPVISLDLFATFAHLAGATLDDGVVRDGVNLLPYLTDDAAGSPHDVLYWRAGPNRAIRLGRWKLFEVNRADPAASHGGGRLLPLQDYPDASPHGQVSLLYDLEDDTGERTNLADQLPERLRDLQDRLDRWEGSLAQPAWPSNRSTITEINGELVQLFF